VFRQLFRIVWCLTIYAIRAKEVAFISREVKR